MVQEPGWRAGAPGRWVDTVYSVHRPELDKLLLAEGVEGRRSAHGMILHHPHLREEECIAGRAQPEDGVFPSW